MTGPLDTRRPLLLALDTATARVGIALYDGDLVAEASWPGGRQGSTTLLPEVDRLLRLTGQEVTAVTAVAVMLGPGSFSALRVGLSTAKGLAMGLGCALIGVPTMDAIAYPHRRPGVTVWALLDAGRARVTARAYRETPEGWQATGTPHHGTPHHGTAVEVAAAINAPAVVCGEASPALVAALADRPGIDVLPPAVRARRAGHLAEIAWRRLQAGDTDDPVTLEPIYVHVEQER